MRSLKWAAPAVLASAALLMSACAGGGTTPSAVPGMGSTAGAQHVGQTLHYTASGKGIQAAAKCNATNFPAGCFPYSIASGLTIDWCAGDSSADPCDQTSSITDWNGNVNALKTMKQVKGIKVTWSGPFACSGNPSACNGFTTGTYEEDAMVSAKKPPHTTKGYKDIQPINGCEGTACGELTAIGISVGP
jgi:hypothetical protein